MQKLNIVYVPLGQLKPATYNPRKWSRDQLDALKESIKRFGTVDPLIANSAAGRENVLIGGHMRLAAIRELGHTEVPIVFVNIADPDKERELNIRLNRNLGEFDFSLLKEFDEAFLKDAGFTSEELDEIFAVEDTPETFDINKELAKLDIKEVKVKKGEVYEMNGSRLMVGDSTVEEDILKLMCDEKASMVMTDPPYRLQYLEGKSRHGTATTGFGAKRNRRYLETESLPADFTEKWMTNAAKVMAKDSSIIVYENWKNIREIWGEMEKHWKVRNMLVWHLPNRNQGYAADRKFFSKHDIAMVGTSDGHPGLNLDEESELLENEYRAALFAISGKPAWEGYKKGNKYCPTDHITFNAADEKSSGQGIIFGVKPTEILIPFIKVLTLRDQLVLEPFGGSGSSLIASLKLKRRCYVMEKSPVYASVILHRWSKFAGGEPKKVA